MINYSIAMRSNPQDNEEPKKAYANAQYSEIMDIDKFAEHLTNHGCVYDKADIASILTKTVSCMRELLLNGYRIRMGDLGTFAVKLKSEGQESPEKFTATNITAVNVHWSVGKDFRNMRNDADFCLVPTRKDTAKVIAAIKAGETTVNLNS